MEDRIVRACKIFFGPDAVVTSDFLSCLNPTSVRSVFRKKALQLHPDRYIDHDEETKRKKTELFIEVNWAREQLLDFFSRRERIAYVRTASRKRAYAAKRRPSAAPRGERTGRFYKGPMPFRKLRFGEYLYYSGAVSWNDFIRAIVWQRRQRPRFGEIARRFRFLSDDDVRFIIAVKKYYEPIGEAAMRMRVLSRFQVGAVLFHQRFIQRPIGEFFVENRKMLRARINQLHESFLRHNARYRRPA